MVSAILTEHYCLMAIEFAHRFVRLRGIFNSFLRVFHKIVKKTGKHVNDFNNLARKLYPRKVSNYMLHNEIHLIKSGLNALRQ